SHARCGSAFGVNHLGLQVDTQQELQTLEARFAEAGLPGLQEHATSCCYARSDKTWLQDPQGIAWENFHTLGSAPVFDGNGPERLRESVSAARDRGATEPGARCCG
ncbi:MAG TPA: glyoxalase/bleomycin resistance/dioxygenase family protein, partial [Nevskiaceae bacterium]|nr:glyoxalase/bleomycin resistance/dioxygenase family protein [Nevskiaceae bacterium]